MNVEKVLVIGGGAREHAVGWKIKQSKSRPQLLFAPGNAGTAELGINLDIGATEIGKIVGAAKDNNAFIFVGPEAPLEKGLVNAARKEGLKIFGPTQEAARLEARKSWAIELMRHYNIPHPKSMIFDSLQKLQFYLKDYQDWENIVIKADGLAAGKGVFLPHSKEEAIDAVKRIMVDKEFDKGSTKPKIIIQERLKGREMSLLVFTDGKTIVRLLPAQDYKRLKDGDEGPNTGGMGAFAPAKMSPDLYSKILDTILRPTVDGMREEGNLFQGVLYAGLMITDDGPKVLEFNVRFGDPEAQVLMMLWKSDLFQALKNTINGKLNGRDISFHDGAAICVVLAAENYPDEPKIGDEIHGLEKFSGKKVKIFHAGTALEDGKVVTNGGRVISIASYGKNIKEARGNSHPHIGEKGVYFDGMQYRKDIGL